MPPKMALGKIKSAVPGNQGWDQPQLLGFIARAETCPLLRNEILSAVDGDNPRVSGLRFA